MPRTPPAAADCLLQPLTAAGVSPTAGANAHQQLSASEATGPTADSNDSGTAARIKCRSLGGGWFTSQLAIYGFAPEEEAVGIRPRCAPCGCGGASRWSILVLALHAAILVAFFPLWIHFDLADDEDNGSQKGGGDGLHGVEFTVAAIGAFGAMLLGFVDRCCLLRAALQEYRRLDTIAKLLPTASQSLTRAKIGTACRCLCLVLWLPTILALFARCLLLMADTGMAAPYLPYLTILLLAQTLLPAMSLNAAAILFWAESIVIAQRTDDIIDVVVQERDISATLATFVDVKSSLMRTGREWTAVLSIQALSFFGVMMWSVTALIHDWGDSEEGRRHAQFEPLLTAACVAPILWPLIISVAAIVRINNTLGSVPQRLTESLLFSPAERCFFADDYSRLGLQLQVLGVQLTSQRLSAAMISGIAAAVLMVMRAIMTQTPQDD
jgi:hypothetical protein